MMRLLRYSSISPILFDCNVAQCFVVSMRNNVQSTRIKNIAPGALYTFIIEQDQNGGHSFEWPPECINATDVDPNPLTKTTQNFIGDQGGFMWANVAGTWR